MNKWIVRSHWGTAPKNTASGALLSLRQNLLQLVSSIYTVWHILDTSVTQALVSLSYTFSLPKSTRKTSVSPV